ncbi:nucleoid-associated protein [Alkaliphilus serpentinus]|uniref:nucleoid-associated protein n=1 Tax=Alkaliphilus serpentinus TaxID=1482731 RepID=UPI0018656E4F|nr:nucleoid-associated protein [Alkaliphilus serpentinus]
MTEAVHVTINQIILHILDSSIGAPVISSKEHPINNDIQEFMEAHLAKILKDHNGKAADFLEDSRVKSIAEEIFKDQRTFVKESGRIASILYEIILQQSEIPSADLLITTFQHQGQTFLGVLKFNYRPSFTHYIHEGEEGPHNSIIKYKTTLPGMGQKADEWAIISLDDYKITLFEREYEIDGEKRSYFSSDFLQSTTGISDMELAKKLKKQTEAFNKKFCNRDMQISDEFGKAIINSIEDEGIINIEKISERVFPNNHELKEVYLNHLENNGFDAKEVEIKEEVIEKVFSKRKIKTDHGIEINITLDNEDNNIEYLNNHDGTISILIKNINSLSYK